MTRLAISITAHERPELLLDQIRNIRRFCVAPVIAIHLSKPLAERLRASEPGRGLLRLIAEEPGVRLNPTEYQTRWAHMFHAHLSNIRMLRDADAGHSHVLLMSSADLFFRAGIESHIAAYDFGGAHEPGFDPHDPPLGAAGGWLPQIMADGVFRGLLRDLGHPLFRHDAHEGSFYRRDLVEAMVALLDARITDWEYDDRYPKEEVFFPCLLQHFPERAGTHRASHVLMVFSNADRDRQAVAAALRDLGLAGAAPLVEWLAAVPEAPGMLDGRFILSRIPRDPGHPLRLLLTNPAPGAAAAIARRLDAIEVLRLDCAGAGGFFQPNGGPPPEVLLRAAYALPWRPLPPLAALAGAGPVTRPLEPCPGRFGQPQLAWPDRPDGAWLCAARLDPPGAEVALSAEPDALLVQPAAVAGAGLWFLYAGIPAPVPGRDRGLIAMVSRPGLAPWIECQWPGGKQKWELGRGFPLGRGAMLWVLPEGLHHFLEAPLPDAAQFLAFLSGAFDGAPLRIGGLAWV